MILITELTWTGHEFLDNIRSKNAFNFAKEAMKSIGSFSLDIFGNVAASYIQRQLGK